MIYVLKLGGGAGVDHAATLQNLANRIRSGERWILVHGASDATNRLADQVGHPAQTIITPSGHSSRYNDARTIAVYSAASATVNQSLVAQLSALDISAVGLAGPNIIHAQRKGAIRAIRDGRQVIIRDDYSGTITSVSTLVINTLLDAGFTPVIAPLAMGENYENLNVDGDLVSANVAQQVGADTLIILSNVPGLLRDVQDYASLITRFNLTDMGQYEHFAAGRMKKKLLAAAHANIARVILADSRCENPIDLALAGGGTHITQNEVQHAR